MSDFIIKEEDFRLKLIEKVPEPCEGECFLLYQAGNGIRNCMVINNGVKYSSTAVRHGYYNKKVTLSLQSVNFSKSYQVVMIDIDFYFKVNVKILYKLQSVQEYYFQGQIEEKDIHHIIRESVKIQNQKWNVSQAWKLQSALETQIEQKLKQYEGVEFKITVDVIPDEAALEMQKSNRDKVVGIHKSSNKTEEQIAINADKKKVAESERELKFQQIEEMGIMMNTFGDLGPIVDEYIQGEIGGKEFYEYIMKARTNDMNLLNMAMSTEMLTQKEAFDKLDNILTSNRFAKAEQQLPDKDKDENDLQEDEDEDEEGDMEQKSFSDGDTL